jgi:pimeloyl-ACP methyl ester carboxylesterase
MRKYLSAGLLVIALAAATASHAPARQFAPPVRVEFEAGGDLIRGRFFPAAMPEPLATLVLIPGFGGDTTDVLGLGARLSARDVNVLIFSNRGVQNSGGSLTYSNALDDAGAALEWLNTPAARSRFHIDPHRIVLGGYSFGGAVAILHAARDTSVRRVLAIAGADHSVYARRIREEHGYREAIRSVLENAKAPRGRVRFDPDALLDEIVANESAYAHPPHAPRFAGRAVLLIGGWEDSTCPVEREILPMYRALKAAPGSDPSVIAYPDGHAFGNSRERLAEDIHAWLVRTTALATHGR